jgi:hypothetical protein
MMKERQEKWRITGKDRTLRKNKEYKILPYIGTRGKIDM